VTNYSYDKNGNEISQTSTKTGETLKRTYDAKNQLSTVSKEKDGQSTLVQSNDYNGDGQRIQKTEGGNTTNYYYQDGVVSSTTDGSGTQTSQNLIGLEGNVIGTERYTSDTTSYYSYNKDIQGSTTSLIKEDGTADATYTYTDFGETRIQGDNTAGNEVCYTGGVYDSTTGLYYLNARYYNPEDGRFLTEDTYRGESTESDTQNLYAYCAGNPVNYVDPSGHRKYPYTKKVKAIVFMLTCDIVYYAEIRIYKKAKLKVTYKKLYLRGAPITSSVKERKYRVYYSKDKKRVTLTCKYLLIGEIPTPWGGIKLSQKLRYLKYSFSERRGTYGLVSKNL
jgi:RHS repeat-associated protein